MIPALLRGKLSGDQENMEDLLTSMVFGQLSYVPPAIGLIRLLERAEYADGRTLVDSFADGAAAVRYVFWPWLDWARIEPDVQIRITQPTRTLLVSIEAKFRSGKSGEVSDDANLLGDQLARQWEGLLAQARVENAVPVMIYLTADYCFPRDALEASALEYSKKRVRAATSIPLSCAWLSWRQVPQLFASSETPILAELAQAVKKLGLTFYGGITELDVLAGADWSFKGEPSAIAANEPTKIFSWLLRDEPLTWRFSND